MRNAVHKENNDFNVIRPTESTKHQCIMLTDLHQKKKKKTNKKTRQDFLFLIVVTIVYW